MHKKIIDIIYRIPAGKVATYGQIAAFAGFPGRARHVGWILNQTNAPNLPWFRVINSKGSISLPHNGKYELQKVLLQEEGIIFDEKDFINLKIFGWKP
ncbi:MAG: MGMT family protein [Deferribacteres bacterium]|nr:MGMT family protein [candidate division KSB1 bacterium]MCB9504330.1 MGMT family protein [Deferribacteres bacterium]